MPPSPRTGDGPTTEQEFEDALDALLRSAHDNGVDVQTGWAYRHDHEYPDWEVQITEVLKPRNAANE